MRLFGLEITLASKAAVPSQPSYIVGDRGRWWYPLVHEPFTGAWQRNMEERPESLLTYHAVYACITMIASDIAKCRLKLMQRGDNDVWSEIENAAHSPVLREPNRYQTRIQFYETWMLSKLINGNTYVLKERDARGLVIAMYVLDPRRTRPMVAPDGEVFYELSVDNLAGLEQSVTVPRSEIIHDMATMRYHHLCGVPPLAPAAMAATTGLSMQRQSIVNFRNSSRPGGLLVAPQRITEEQAARIKDFWEQKFSGENTGRVAVLGDGMQYTPLDHTAVEAQLVEQQGVTAKQVCSSFQVPAYMIGVGEMPAYNNIEALNQQYYSQCLQKHFEAIELLLDTGLALNTVPGKVYGTEFDLDALLRMDTAARIKAYADAVKGGLMKPNEGRAKLDLEPVTGGDDVYLQQQNYSLAALAKRDAKDDPFATGKAPAPPDAGNDNEPADDQEEETGDGEEDDAEEARGLAAAAAWRMKLALKALPPLP